MSVVSRRSFRLVAIAALVLVRGAPSMFCTCMPVALWNQHEAICQKHMLHKTMHSTPRTWCNVVICHGDRPSVAGNGDIIIKIMNDVHALTDQFIIEFDLCSWYNVIQLEHRLRTPNYQTESESGTWYRIPVNHITEIDKEKYENSGACLARRPPWTVSAPRKRLFTSEHTLTAGKSSHKPRHETANMLQNTHGHTNWSTIKNNVEGRQQGRSLSIIRVRLRVSSYWVLCFKSIEKIVKITTWPLEW